MSLLPSVLAIFSMSRLSVFIFPVEEVITSYRVGVLIPNSLIVIRLSLFSRVYWPLGFPSLVKWLLLILLARFFC